MLSFKRALNLNHRTPTLFFCSILTATGFAAPTTWSKGNVRIEFLSKSLIRLEQKGPRGFEDRKTFLVVNRTFGPSVSLEVKDGSDRSTVVIGGNFKVTVPSNPKALAGISVADATGKSIYQCSAVLPKNGYLPAPGDAIAGWTLSDAPRLIPPAWGATPAPVTVSPALKATSGWDERNDAPDLYIFSPGAGGYRQLRKDFVGLTGSIPKPPVSVLGFIDSRWFPYTEKQALDSIDTYRSKGIPLDTFVVDTDWRVNGSDGYAVEPKYFPDMPRFMQEAHDRHVKLMFNDHPGPVARTATDPAELKFRYDGLTKLLDWGLDYWWYDRNWSTNLHEPMPGIAKEVWGQTMYHDITLRDRPGRRPWIMSNAEGIDNGHVDYPPNPAGHRFPMMWTGDTGSLFKFLQYGVENGVNRGVDAFQPYTHEDLGGHTGPTPSPELYVRYLEYGCLSPITRLHCTLGQDRHPWAYGPEAEKIVTDYIKLRYRLLPTIYSAAQRATDDGTPILRRCDLEWPTYKEATADDQYLLGDDILVAPIEKSIAGEAVPVPDNMFRTIDGQPGIKAEFYDNKDLQGTPKMVRNDPRIDFELDGVGPADGIPAQNFSARWTGSIGPVPSNGLYTLTTTNDDGVRVYVDDKLVIDDWKPEDSAVNTAKLQFTAGSTHRLRIEYLQLGGGAILKLGWQIPGKDVDPNASHRSVWIPPGQWENVWTRTVEEGPKTIQTVAPLAQIPMWTRVGGIILSGQDLQYTGEKPGSAIVANVFLAAKGIQSRELDEDDGISNDYLKGAVARTRVQLSDSGSQATIKIEPTAGHYKSMLGERSWIVSIHVPDGITVAQVLVDGKPAEIKGDEGKELFGGTGGLVHIDVAPSSIRSAHVITVSYK